mmetsp:Transcript_22703/g.37456  ORF Transcript_22703/g.37456 Transcript_22703/m.37456 type:complete len:221 (+) Transcript_22703:391-1053(+)
MWGRFINPCARSASVSATSTENRACPKSPRISTLSSRQASSAWAGKEIMNPASNPKILAPILRPAPSNVSRFPKPRFPTPIPQLPCDHVYRRSHATPRLRPAAGQTDPTGAKLRYAGKCLQSGQTHWQSQSPCPCQTTSPEPAPAALPECHQGPCLQNQTEQLELLFPVLQSYTLRLPVRRVVSLGQPHQSQTRLQQSFDRNCARRLHATKYPVRRRQTQ